MKECKSNFTILPFSHGHYKVFYQSPKTKTTWFKVITDMELIDNVKHIDYPTQNALKALKAAVKRKP
jgi:hypothetical protein